MKKLLLLSLAAIYILTGCNSDNGNDPITDDSRTVIAYFIADNNLYQNALIDINEMESAWDDSFNGNMLVFLNGENGTNVLYHIRKGTDPETIESDVVKMYSTGSHVCSKEFLNQVISDAMKLFPAQTYALDLWSHGNSWLPEGMHSPLYISSDKNLQSDGEPIPFVSVFGKSDTNQETFEVYDLADALSPYNFDFIMFDACQMGSIECAYQMKDICDYYIASAAETMVDGFPYNKIMVDMFSTPANVVGIAEKFFEYYDSRTDYGRSATISVVETEKLGKVAEELSNIVTPAPSIPTGDIQQYGRRITYMDDCLYDLNDFVEKTWGMQKSVAFSDALSHAVIYKAATPNILSEIEVRTFCGLSSYIPLATQPVTNSEFKLYDWATDSGLSDIF